MACGSCGTGKPNGCKSNGGCSSGGCNRMNVFDWLLNLPINDANSACKIIEVSFNNGSRKDFFRNPTSQYFSKGELITVEGVSGFDVGEVSLSGELVRLQLKKKGVDEFNPEIKKLLRRSNTKDIEVYQQNKNREQEVLMRSRSIARDLNLQMKLTEVEIQADGKKGTFFYTSDDRVDFRELIKIFASEFRLKVEMRQIGIRQQAAKVGGIGSCGRELCCSTWLSDFKSVTTTVARYQNLSINQTKLSGQCGRLKCCLNYELDIYLDALQHFPENAETLETAKGMATLIKKDIFKNLMWYTLPESNKQYPLTISRVKEIAGMNSRGEKVDELRAVELAAVAHKDVEPEFVDVVGQISLRSLERNSKKRKNKNRRERKDNESKSNTTERNESKEQQNNKGQQKPKQASTGNGNNNTKEQQARPQPADKQQPLRPQQTSKPPQQPKPEQPNQNQQPNPNQNRNNRHRNNRRRPPRQDQ